MKTTLHYSTFMTVCVHACGAECVPEKSSDDNCGDWDYNEDMGYDPYMGCYTDDC